MFCNKLSFCLAFFLMISLISCEDEPFEGSGQPQDGGQSSDLNAVFEATLSDTINFSATQISAELTDDGLQFSGTMNNERIGFNVPDASTGPKDFSSSDVDGFYDPDVQESINEFFTAQEGVLNIENLDTLANMISGSFSGQFNEVSSNDTLNITEGVFTDINFVDNTSSQNEVAAGSLTVDIDGETNTFDLTENSFPDDQDVDVYTFLQANEDDPLGSKTVTLNLPSDVNQGSFDVNNYADQGNVLNPHSFRYDNPSENLIVFSVENTGQINISNVSDTIIEGTFNFDGQDLTGDQNLSFTNGSFTIELE